MVSSYVTHPLEAHHLPLAYPLISAKSPQITLATWVEFATRYVDGRAGARGSGAIGLRREGGYISGLAMHRIESELLHEKVLFVDLFMALDLVGQTAAAQMLFQTLEAIAQGGDCSMMCVRLVDQTHLAAVAEAAGFATQDRLYCKPVARFVRH